MTNAAATQESLELRESIARLFNELLSLRSSWHIAEESEDYDFSYSSLNRAYSDDEPVYTHDQLIMKNPRYVSRR